MLQLKFIINKYFVTYKLCFKFMIIIYRREKTINFFTLERMHKKYAHQFVFQLQFLFYFI